VVVRGGEVIGTWRDRRGGKGSDHRQVSVELFDRPARGVRGAIEDRARHLFGEVEIEIVTA
jgi:hypothetical protein